MRTAILIFAAILSISKQGHAGTSMILDISETKNVAELLRASALRGDDSLTFWRAGKMTGEHHVGIDFLNQLDELVCSLSTSELNCYIGSEFTLDIELDANMNFNPNGPFVVEVN